MATEKNSDGKKYWLDEKKNVDKVWYALIAICAVIVIADLFYRKKVEFAVEDVVPGMYGLYGFVACVFLVLSAKLLRKLVSRPEDYYDKTDD